MSVHLMLTNTSKGEGISVPVATESFFLKAWRPFAIKRSLHLVEAMQSGYDIDQTSLINLINELRILKNSMYEIDYLTEDERTFLEGRVNFILDEIESESSYPQVKGWVA